MTKPPPEKGSVGDLLAMTKPPPKPHTSPTYLFRYILLVNTLLYLEAGAVPALLLTLSQDFSMNQQQQGMMGGIGEKHAGLRYLLLHVPNTLAL